MTNDSTTKTKSEIQKQAMKSPRISTVNFIRQFSRAYVVLGGLATANSMIIN